MIFKIVLKNVLVVKFSTGCSPEGEHLLMAGTPVSHEDAEDPSKIRKISDRMKKDLSAIYPDFEGSPFGRGPWHGIW